MLSAAGNACSARAIVAVDARYRAAANGTYQPVHHGLWDYDIPCAPILCDIPVNGKTVKALAQPTKQSWLYVLNRARRASRSGRSSSGRFRRATCPANGTRRPSRILTKPPAYDVAGRRHRTT